jgi:hypothetical protein
MYMYSLQIKGDLKKKLLGVIFSGSTCTIVRTRKIGNKERRERRKRRIGGRR